MPPPMFTKDNDGSWFATLDLRTSPASRMNAKLYTNATIAISRGRLPSGVTVQTNGQKVLFRALTIGAAYSTYQWIEVFQTNWGNSGI